MAAGALAERSAADGTAGGSRVRLGLGGTLGGLFALRDELAVTAQGKLDALMSPEPTAGERARAYIFGFTTLTIGIVLAVFIWGLGLTIPVLPAFMQR